MFDQLHHHHQHSAPYPQKVEQQLAPTADLLRVFGEMRTAARDSIVEERPLEGNFIGKTLEFSDDAQFIYATFVLNGVRTCLKVEKHGKAFIGPNAHHEIYNAVCANLAHAFLHQLFPQAYSRLAQYQR